ncbi:sugar phosphate nucleotidyltransferase [Alicyclobacillus macrosporangiidus]|uniref:sugar phosphate nucleotidyltransferase n=1 Tax=Alicyclobacillus macrosporangiidus TaxID=392015 RepID=UPI0004966A10|nr:sugar phosphate nucleotidyltransferase [Alicyclobacillus macrosporangiidus]
MKGVILAGGTGSRLYPLTRITNKHLLPVGRYPMIYYAIAKLAGANVRDILIVTGREHMGDVVNLLGSGHQFDCEFTYRVQDQAGGIAQALGLAEKFAAGDSVVVVLGDNVFEDSLGPLIEDFSSGARVFLKEVPDPSRFGVPVICDGRIVAIEEKPAHPGSPYAVTGIYLYDNQVFEIVRSLKPSARGELEITDVNNAYLERGQLSYVFLNGWWTDAGTHVSYAQANQLARDVRLGPEFEQKG